MFSRSAESIPSKMFYKNVQMLTRVIPPSKEFEKHFKERMFDRPNTEGFIHAVHYLLNIYNEQYFKKNIEWPLLDKKSEAMFRKDIKNFLTIIANENKDLQFPQVLASHLITASGKKFITLMYKLSTAALREFLKKNGDKFKSKVPLLMPNRSNPIVKKLLHNKITKDTARLNKKIAEVKQVQNTAKEYTKKTVESIEQMQKNILLKRQQLCNFVARLSFNDNMKKRLLDLNDSALIEEWNKNVNVNIQQLELKMESVKQIRNQTIQVNGLLKSLYEGDEKILNGNNLPVINTKKLLEILLDSEAQIALENLYIGNELNLNNMFVILASILNYYRVNLKYLQLVHLPEINQQLIVGAEDMKIIISIMDTTKEKTLKLLTETNEMIESAQPMMESINFQLDNTMYYSNCILQDSPKISLQNSDIKNDMLESLQLTPVEYSANELLKRYARHQDYIKSEVSLECPQVIVKRINFDESMPMTSRDETLNISHHSKLSKSLHTLEARIGPKMANLLKLPRGKSMNLTSNQWRTSTFIDANRSVYDQRAGMPNASIISRNFELTTPPRGTSSQTLSLREKSFGIQNIGIPNFNSTASDLKAVTESTKIENTNESYNTLQNINVKLSKEKKLSQIKSNNIDENTQITEESDVPQDVNKTQKCKESGNRRSSISDLVERFNRIRERATRAPDLKDFIDEAKE